MKLHEAIAKGIEKTKRYRGRGYTAVIDGQHYASVLGAAFYGECNALAEQDRSVPQGLKLSIAFPVLDVEVKDLVMPPLYETEDGCYFDLWDVITELNKTEMSREEINKWIKEVEEHYVVGVA